MSCEDGRPHGGGPEGAWSAPRRTRPALALSLIVPKPLLKDLAPLNQLVRRCFHPQAVGFAVSDLRRNEEVLPVLRTIIPPQRVIPGSSISCTSSIAIRSIDVTSCHSMEATSPILSCLGETWRGFLFGRMLIIPIPCLRASSGQASEYEPGTIS